MQKAKSRVDFNLSMGSVPSMLKATKPVLSERQYKELCRKVDESNSYMEQKRIIFSYVEPIIKK
jgi:hypothetical protein